MKKYLVFILFFFSVIQSYAQDLPNIKNVKLNKKSSYIGTEPLVLKVIDYLYATPIDKKNSYRTDAGQFLLKWMNGTPDHTFYIEEKQAAFFNTDSDLMLIYMASLTKFILENPSAKDQKTLVLGSMNLALPYLSKQEDKKAWPKGLEQLVEANKKGELEKYLYP